MKPHWRVLVETSGEEIVSIEPQMLSGRDISKEDKECIRNAAHHLLSFIADPSMDTGLVAKPLSCWHEDLGPVVWWKFPVEEPSWIGTPLDTDWPGYHTHWTPHPSIPQTLQGNS